MSGDTISANISGGVNGEVAVGMHIAQNQTMGATRASSEDLAQLRAAFAQLAAQVDAQAPPQRRLAAAERIGELEQACLADEPDITTIQYVARWFQSNVPQLAGAVAGIVVHPIVGKLVGAAADTLLAEFRHSA